jgi:hypothetical protein
MAWHTVHEYFGQVLASCDFHYSPSECLVKSDNRNILMETHLVAQEFLRHNAHAGRKFAGASGVFASPRSSPNFLGDLCRPPVAAMVQLRHNAATAQRKIRFSKRF